MSNVVHWTVPLDHPAFAGHFPGTPILPGVVLLDIALQAIAKTNGIRLDRCEITLAKFLSPAGPGDMLAIQHETTASGAIRFDILCGMRKIASGAVTTSITE